MPERSRDLPALLGGIPVRPEGPPRWPFPDPEVQSALAAAVASGDWGQYHGEQVSELERELAEYHGVPHVLTCASGTLAVEAALRALRVGPGDEVVLAAYEYEANFLTVHALGAQPVLIDVHPETWQLDPAHLAAAIGPRTRAVICSHLHGGTVEMPAVVELCRSRGVGVVEDAAQATGAWVGGRPAGTWGDAGTLSFGGSKLLSAGRGGAVLFTDPALYQRAKVWLRRGPQQWAPLSELQAAVLRPQLRKLPEATARRAENVAALLRALADIPGLTALCVSAVLAGDRPAFYKLGFRYDPGEFGLTRDRFVDALRAEGVAFDAGFKGLHVGRSPTRFRAVGELTQATAAHHRCLVLHHPVLSGTASEVNEVANAVAKTYRNRQRIADLP
jgi:perosamine synthetase